MPAKSAPKKLKIVKSKADTKESLLKVYEDMLFLRRFEERAATLYQQAVIAGFCHLYIGQEAVITGCRAVTEKGDDYITSYRCHAHALACGIPPEKVMAELTGRIDGISKGKGGSMHMFSKEHNFWGGHGIVAAQVPMGAGLAFANKHFKNGNVSMVFIGDGAMNAGQTFETLNMAALWKLPAVFVIENNVYGMGTSVARAAAGDLYKRGEPFGIPSVEVDGMDFFAVRDAMTKAVNHARSGKGPYIVEAHTYRYKGHSMSDPAKYRTRDEVEKYRKENDPIINLSKVLDKKFKVKDDSLKKIDKAVKDKIEKVVEFATNSPEPQADELYTDVL
jgi:pyruvate dehydrogenase E1 component alpha subunit